MRNSLFKLIALLPMATQAGSTTDLKKFRAHLKETLPNSKDSKASFLIKSMPMGQQEQKSIADKKVQDQWLIKKMDDFKKSIADKKEVEIDESIANSSTTDETKIDDISFTSEESDGNSKDLKYLNAIYETNQKNNRNSQNGSTLAEDTNNKTKKDSLEAFLKKYFEDDNEESEVRGSLKQLMLETQTERRSLPLENLENSNSSFMMTFGYSTPSEILLTNAIKALLQSKKTTGSFEIKPFLPQWEAFEQSNIVALKLTANDVLLIDLNQFKSLAELITGIQNSSSSYTIEEHFDSRDLAVGQNNRLLDQYALINHISNNTGITLGKHDSIQITAVEDDSTAEKIQDATAVENDSTINLFNKKIAKIQDATAVENDSTINLFNVLEQIDAFNQEFISKFKLGFNNYIMQLNEFDDVIKQIFMEKINLK